MAERFTVGTVTGYKITPGAGSRGGGGRPPLTLWSVHDTAYCHRTLYEGFDERYAREMAAALNEKEKS